MDLSLNSLNKCSIEVLPRMPEDHQYLFHFLLSSLQLRLGCQRFLVRLPVIFSHDKTPLIMKLVCIKCNNNHFHFPVLSFEKGHRHLKIREWELTREELPPESIRRWMQNVLLAHPP